MFNSYILKTNSLEIKDRFEIEKKVFLLMKIGKLNERKRDKKIKKILQAKHFATWNIITTFENLVA